MNKYSLKNKDDKFMDEVIKENNLVNEDDLKNKNDLHNEEKGSAPERPYMNTKARSRLPVEGWFLPC